MSRDPRMGSCCGRDWLAASSGHLSLQQHFRCWGSHCSEASPSVDWERRLRLVEDLLVAFGNPGFWVPLIVGPRSISTEGLKARDGRTIPNNNLI